MTSASAPRWHRLLASDPRGAKLRVLDFLLHRFVPFNRPHGLRLLRVSESGISVLLPRRRRNLNHLGGLHACALAAAAEYSTGLLLLRRIDPAELRLIMRTLTVGYSKQGRGSAIATAILTNESFESEILSPLAEKGVADVTLEASVADEKGGELCRARVEWQVKRWAMVR